MNVEWTENAVRHLTAVHDYIAQNSPIYARKMAGRLTRRFDQIADHPRSGRRVPEYGDDDIRELIEGDYRLIYRIDAEAIHVLAIVHGARRLPETVG